MRVPITLNAVLLASAAAMLLTGCGGGGGGGGFFPDKKPPQIEDLAVINRNTSTPGVTFTSSESATFAFGESDDCQTDATEIVKGSNTFALDAL